MSDAQGAFGSVNEILEARRLALELVALRKEPEISRLRLIDYAHSREWGRQDWVDFVGLVAQELYGTLHSLEIRHPETARILDEIVRATTEPDTEGER